MSIPQPTSRLTAPAQSSHSLHRRPLISTLIIAAALLITASALWLLQPAELHASREGRVAFSGNPAINDGQTCTTCHGLGDGSDNDASVSLTLDGPMSVNSGETVRYTAVISGGPAIVGGIGVSMGNVEGTLTALENNLQIIDGELTHRLPQAFSNDGTLRFSFEWTAPEYGTTLSLYAAGVSGNNSNDPLGDSVGASSVEITVAGPSETPTPTPTVTPADSVILERVASGLRSPVDIQNAGDERLFIVEQSGNIRILNADGTQRDVSYLDIEEQVDDSGNEMGLLGLAFHPNYASNGYFYVNYNVSSPRRTRISRFKVSDDANRADTESETILMEFGQPNSNHNGGQVAFGPDGYLYIGTGDGGGGGDPDQTGQDNSQMLGKILRIDVDESSGTAPDCRGETVSENHYTIPTNNPFVDEIPASTGGNCDEIWSTGWRNPWRFSFDAVTGDMWVGDVGQNQFEEIDFQPASSTGGQNYGWRCYEADDVYRTDQYYQDTCFDSSQYVFPVYKYGRSQGCSVTGGIVYRGSDYPGLNGQYIFADFCTADLWSLRGDANNQELEFTTFGIDDGGSLSSPSTFGEDHRGELYVASRGGSVYQIKTNGIVPTQTPTPVPSDTPVPTATDTSPTASGTPSPAETETPVTGTPEPQETNTATPEPSPTGGSMVIPTKPASIAAAVAAGAPASQFTFTASHLDPLVTATILINGIDAGTVPTDAEGTARFVLNTDPLPDGAYIVRIQTVEDLTWTRIVIDENAPLLAAMDDTLQLVNAPGNVLPASEMMMPAIINE